MHLVYLLAAVSVITSACSVGKTFQTRALEAWEPEAGWLAEANLNSGKVRLLLDSHVEGALDISAYVLYRPKVKQAAAPECFHEYYSFMTSDVHSKIASERFHLKSGNNHVAVPLDAYLPGRCNFQPSSISFLVRDSSSGARTHPIFNWASIEIRQDAPPLMTSTIYCGVCTWNPKPSESKDLFVNCQADKNLLRISPLQEAVNVNFKLVSSQAACGRNAIP